MSDLKTELSIHVFRDASKLAYSTVIFLRKVQEEKEIVDKLILERYLKSLHAGVQFVLADIRQHFWILRGRKILQRVILKWVRCRRHDSRGVESVPTTLPEDRIRDSLVFEVSGVDLAGLLHLKDGKKAWILLFTCAVYRAVHLELIRSLTASCFILGFRRFIARRGRPKIMYSDNGSNFVGTDKLLKSIDWDKIINDASIFRIQWKFNPPTAAWWGGRVLGKACLMYEEMSTILCDVEAVINGRPLTYISEDSKDLLPLTSSMFIQDIRDFGVPDLDHIDTVSITKRWKYQQS
nr:uncharacterized protein LOC122271981 [Parasteatoda tepidariorum]